MEMYEVLAAVRKEKKVQFDELSQKTGLSVSTLKKILTGVTKAPLFENVRSIAYALDLTLDDLDMRIMESNQQHSDVLYVSRPSGNPTTDEMRKHLHDLIDQLDDEDLRLLSDVTIRFQKN